MRLDPTTPTPAALAELGFRLAEARRQRGLTQEALAEAAGTGVATLRRIEDGRDARLGTWVRLLQALGFGAGLEGLLPENFRSPLAEVREERRGAGPSRRRVRTRGSKGRGARSEENRAEHRSEANTGESSSPTSGSDSGKLRRADETAADGFVWGDERP